MSTVTCFASLDDYTKGSVEIIGDDAAPRYLFSNMFEVAKQAQPWERVVVAKNLEFTVECARENLGVVLLQSLQGQRAASFDRRWSKPSPATRCSSRKCWDPWSRSRA